MKRYLSAPGLLWIALTSMIGSGWLFGALYSAHFAGPAAMIAWPLAGFLLLFVALCYAEVATMFPQADSLSRLPLYTHGHLTSVIMSCLAWISLAIIPVVETQGLMQYASNYSPNLMTHQGIHYSMTTLGYLVALFLLLSFTLLNFFGIKLFARVNAIFTIWKLLVPTLTIICLLLVNFYPANFSKYDGFMPYGWHGVMAAMSSGGVLFSLLGFRQVVVMMSQIEKPGKYVPLILISAIALTTLLYTGLQLAFIGSMRPQDLLHGWANLSFSGQAGPFAALAAFSGMLWLSRLLYVDALLSPYSTALVYSTTSAQMLASLGSMQEAPRQLAKTNKFQAPWISLIVNFLLATVMLFLLPNWQRTAAFIVTVLMISYVIGPVSLICLRRQLPAYTRPFRLRCAPLIAIVGFYVCTAGAYWSGLRSILVLLVLTALCLLSYLFYFRILKKIKSAYDVRHVIWLLVYLGGLGIFSYLGNYGGRHFIPQYWDQLYLLGFSWLILGLALLCRKPAISIHEA